MTTANEAKFREEFESQFSIEKELYAKRPDGEYFLSAAHNQWLGYLAACKKRQEEADKLDYVFDIEDLNRTLKEINGDLEKKLESLQAQNDALKYLFDDSETWISKTILPDWVKKKNETLEKAKRSIDETNG